MKIKIVVLGIVVLITTLMVGGANAQEAPQRPGEGVLRQVVQIVTQETGLSAQEVVEAVRAGSTLAEVITNSGGDVDVVITETAAVITDRVNEAVANGTITQERADTALTDLETRLTDLINGNISLGGGVRDQIQERFGRQLLASALDTTGLTPVQLLQTLREGGTLAEAIEANGGDVNMVVADAVATITQAVNDAVTNGTITQEQADTILQDLEQRLLDALNGGANLAGLLQRGVRNNLSGQDRAARTLVASVGEATGLDTLDVIVSVQGGSTLADVLTASGIDVTGFVDDTLEPLEVQLAEAVETGRISQAVADARLELRRAELVDALNRTAAQNVPSTSS